MGFLLPLQYNGNCSRCKKTKNVNEFTDPHKICDKCIEYKKHYYINKKDGIEIVKEPKVKFEVKTYCCDVCNYEVLLCKKNSTPKLFISFRYIKKKRQPRRI